MTDEAKTRVTEIVLALSEAGAVDPASAEELMPLVYDELRRLAGEDHGVSVEDEIEDRLAGSENHGESDDASEVLLGVEVQDAAGMADSPTDGKAG